MPTCLPGFPFHLALTLATRESNVHAGTIKFQKAHKLFVKACGSTVIPGRPRFPWPLAPECLTEPCVTVSVEPVHTQTRFRDVRTMTDRKQNIQVHTHDCDTIVIPCGRGVSVMIGVSKSDRKLLGVPPSDVNWPESAGQRGPCGDAHLPFFIISVTVTIIPSTVRPPSAHKQLRRCSGSSAGTDRCARLQAQAAQGETGALYKSGEQ